MNTSNIGERIRQLRKQNHMTQDELAGKLDASRVQVNQWESGSRELSNARLIRLAEFFNVSCDYLLTGKDNAVSKGLINDSSVDKEPSFAEYLNQNIVDALNSVDDFPDEKKELYQLVINGLLGSNAFWNVIIPSAVKAIEIQKGHFKSGTVPIDLKNKFDECAQILNLANRAGYSDKKVISDKKAADYEVFVAKELFSNLLQSLIDYYSDSGDMEKPEILNEYDPKLSDTNEIDDFIRFLNRFEIEF